MSEVLPHSCIKKNSLEVKSKANNFSITNRRLIIGAVLPEVLWSQIKIAETSLNWVNLARCELLIT